MPDMVEFDVPRPPSCLSPNRSVHWRKEAAAKKAYAETVWLAARTMKPGAAAVHIVVRGDHEPWEKAAVHLTWYSCQQKDVDNIVGHCKALIDGCSSKGQKPLSIFVDDKHVTVTAEWQRERKRDQQRVHVRIERRDG